VRSSGTPFTAKPRHHGILYRNGDTLVRDNCFRQKTECLVTCGTMTTMNAEEFTEVLKMDGTADVRSEYKDCLQAEARPKR